VKSYLKFALLIFEAKEKINLVGPNFVFTPNKIHFFCHKITSRSEKFEN
jgi:hypothetical protein